MTPPRAPPTAPPITPPLGDDRDSRGMYLDLCLDVLLYRQEHYRAHSRNILNQDPSACPRVTNCQFVRSGANIIRLKSQEIARLANDRRVVSGVQLAEVRAVQVKIHWATIDGLQKVDTERGAFGRQFNKYFWMGETDLPSYVREALSPGAQMST